MKNDFILENPSPDIFFLKPVSREAKRWTDKVHNAVYLTVATENLAGTLQAIFSWKFIVVGESQAQKRKLKIAKDTQEKNYKHFTEISHSGRNLLKKHGLNEVGLWRVFGEDANCDFGGSHHEPDLGLFQGKLEDVIRTAVNLKGFWQWGGGGRIVKAEPEEIKSV